MERPMTLTEMKALANTILARLESTPTSAREFQAIMIAARELATGARKERDAAKRRGHH